MYYLLVNYYIPDDDQYIVNDNGIFEMYSEDYNKLLDMRDLISLDFLGKLSFYSYTLCMCEELGKKCNSCMKDCVPVRRRCREKKWNLGSKHETKFLVDIYSANHTGGDISVFLEDVYSGKLNEYYIEMMKKRDIIVNIPELKYNINTVECIPKNMNKDYVYWNKYVHFDEDTFLNEVLTCRYDDRTIISFLDKLKYS